MDKLASLADIPADRGLKIERGDDKILLVRDGAEVRAYGAVCPHAGAPLEEGAVCDGLIVCPWHKAAFRLSDGALAEPPALDPLPRFTVRVEGDDVYVGKVEPSASPRRTQEDARTFAIVGAGAAGVAAASALREFGFAGRVLLIGSEPGPPFDRTCLSKFVMSGEMKPQEIPPLRPDTFYKEQNIERIAAEVVRFDAKARDLWLGDGRRFAFDAALLATGGEPKSLKLPGAELQGVHLLRGREDAAALVNDVRSGARAVVLGASFIGLEVASGLRQQKMDVTVIAPETVPLAAIFGARIGKVVQALHEANGVKFALPAKARRLTGQGRVAGVELEDGRLLDADLVVVGLGVRPATRFLQNLPLRDDGGLDADTGLGVSENLWAAGDVAAFPYGLEGERVRVEHWRVAQQQSRVAAANMLGRTTAYDAAPFFWTYHYGKNFEYLGHARTWDEEIVLGEPETGPFVALYLQGERVAAVAACDRQRATAALAERMRRPFARDEALGLVESFG